MSIKSNLMKAAGLGVVVAAMSAGAAFAAVATTSVNVRSGPGTGYSVIDQLYGGQRVNILRTAGSWCYVNQNGPNGWVSCGYLSNGAYVQRPVAPPSVNFSLGIGPGYGPGFYVGPSRPHYPQHRRDRHDHNGGQWWMHR